MLSLRAISRPQGGGARGQADGTHHGSGLGRAWGHSLQPHPGRRRLCRHRAPSEPPRARPDPTPSTGGKPGGTHRTPAASPCPAGPCSGEEVGVGGTGSASPTIFTGYESQGRMRRKLDGVEVGPPPGSIPLRQRQFSRPGVWTGSQRSMGPQSSSLDKRGPSPHYPTVKDLYPSKIFPDNVLYEVGTP